MKTPEEIKEGLECCAEYGNCSKGCPYNTIKDCGHDLYSDALAYIQRLERERDAAMEDMKNRVFGCHACKHLEYSPDGEMWTCTLPFEKRSASFGCWQWRGVQEVE